MERRLPAADFFVMVKLVQTCGVSILAISQIENNKRTTSVDLLVKLSKALCCEMEDLT
ncbi:MAG: helix-turn-helix transcriptional regulator [Deltaproteobacteria bacterium]